MLAGLFKAPAKYAPHINLPAARARANEVLTNMVQGGFMTEGQVLRGAAQSGRRRRPRRHEEPRLLPRLGLRGGQAVAEEEFRVHIRWSRAPRSTSNLQRAAEESSSSTCASQRQGPTASSRARIVMIENGGAVRAMVGGRDYGASQFNRATKALRQPARRSSPMSMRSRWRRA
jgi:penicillin-binding protein 1A